MKLQIQREQLLQLLQHIIGVVERRQTLPILANVLVVADDNRLTLTATDLEVELSATAELIVDTPGRTTLPGRKLFDILRALPDEAALTLDVDGSKATLRAGRSRFSLATLPADELPTLERVSGERRLRLPQPALKKLIERSQFAMAQQDVRYYLNGLLLELGDGRLRAVATDGHRMALSDVSAAIEALSASDDAEDAQAESAGSHGVWQVIVPRKGVQELSRLLTDDAEATVELLIDSNHLRAQLGTICFTSKLIDGKFPDYQRAIPATGERVAVLDRREARNALSRAAILANENRGIRLYFDDWLLRIQANNPEQEEAEEELEINYQGGALEIGFNVSYLLDALGVMESDVVKLFVTDAGSSCLLCNGGDDDDHSRYVISPMRL